MSQTVKKVLQWDNLSTPRRMVILRAFGMAKVEGRLLESVYEQFTEGFDAPDLRDAKALMENLKRSVDRKQSECAGKTSNKSRRR